ncbi:MAG: DUF4390 domain-containing protein [Acidobacteriota bacterium]
MLQTFRVFVGVLAAAIAAAPAVAQEAARPRMGSVHAEARGPDVFLKFSLEGALNPELASKIETGLETAIRYDVRLYRHNANWLWDDRIDARRYRVAVTFDPVTREYVSAETLDGKPLARSSTRDFAEVLRRLVSRDNLLVFRVGEPEPHRNLYVEVRAVFDSGYLFTIIPVDARTPWSPSNRFDVRISP